MLICLLRHGLTQENLEKRYQGRRDVPLCPQGLAQLCRADFAPKTVSAFPRCGAGCGRRAERDGLWRV